MRISPNWLKNGSRWPSGLVEAVIEIDSRTSKCMEEIEMRLRCGSQHKWLIVSTRDAEILLPHTIRMTVPEKLVEPMVEAINRMGAREATAVLRACVKRLATWLLGRLANGQKLLVIRRR